jgi:hypothetical protein
MTFNPKNFRLAAEQILSLVTGALRRLASAEPQQYRSSDRLGQL